MNTTLFERFIPTLLAEQPPIACDPRLLLDSDGDIQIYYNAMEHNSNPDAKIILIGITPGPTQMVNANDAARVGLQQGKDLKEILFEAKKTGAFSGKGLRTNLVNQLNHWGFHTWLGLQDSAELFSSARKMLQTASLLRYPVFIKGKPYRGNPDMTKHPLLKQYLLNHFVNEMKEMNKALLIPLGPLVQKVLHQLADEGNIDRNRIINGLLHPSGQNTYRINYLIGDRKKPVPHATKPIPYDQGRKAFCEHFLFS